MNFIFTAFYQSLLGSRVKINLKITYIALILWIGTRGSICFCNKAVANDYLLSLFTTGRKVANDSEFSDCQWYKWQLMTASGTKGKITISTIGKTPNVPCIPSELQTTRPKDNSP